MTDDDFLYFAVDRVDWDGPVDYEITYTATSGSKPVQTGVSTLAVSDYVASDVADGSTEITVTVDYDSAVSGQGKTVSTSVTCTTTTMAPTKEPTTDPTLMPTTDPPTSPTPDPTYDDPGIYMSSSRFSPLSRGECWQEQRSCCTPFGSEYNDTTLTDGYIPGGGCNHQFYPIQIDSTSSELTKESITVRMYPDDFGLDMDVSYTITSYGVINASILESGPWLDGESNTSNGTNDLNMYMHPPGSGFMANHSVTVVASDCSDSDDYCGTDIPLNVTSSVKFLV